MVDENIITLKEAARRLNRNARNLSLVARQGKLKGAFKVGGRWNVDWDKLIASTKPE